MNEASSSEKENCCGPDEGCKSANTETKNVEENEKVEAKSSEQLAKEEAQTFKDKFYYLAAEHENFKKRFEREKVNLIKFGLEGILKDLVDVVDNFDRTVDALGKDQDEKVKNISTGIQMVRTQFLEVLKKQGLTQLDAKGKDFDPNFHEALTSNEVAGTKAGVILDEFQKGYILNGRLLRASKVVVSK